MLQYIYIFLISTLSLTVQSTPTFTTSEVTSISTRASPIVRPSSDTSVGSSSDAHRSRNFSGNVHSPGASAPQTQSQPHHDVHHNWRKRVQQQALSVRLFLFFLSFFFFFLSDIQVLLVQGIKTFGIFTLNVTLSQQYLSWKLFLP